MTADEERQYLCDLIMSASEWRLSEGDERDTLRLEIQDRLRRLNGVETEDENGLIQSDPVEVSPVLTQDDYQALEAKKLDGYLEQREKNRKAKEKYNKKNVRVFMDGKPVWKPREECHQELRFPNRPECTSFRWVWDGPQDKKAQEEQMWEQHEAENA